MCGFVAVHSLSGRPDEAVLRRMTSLLQHRGPDDDGHFVEGSVGLGFRRLAILDLASSGHQPMVSADGRYVIVFNGEIYNYLELRRELESLGHTFRSSGDTEVLLTACAQWGRGALSRLNGMWAFVLYDRQRRRLLGARDRFGVKPMFWFRNGESIVIASEIKAIRDSGIAALQPNYSTVAAHALEGRLDEGEQTFYADVTHVPAGTGFEIDEQGTVSRFSHWSLAGAIEAAPALADPIAAFADTFESAVRLRMRSDVPVGVLLSGGMDSTAIICAMARTLDAAPPRRAALAAFCYTAPEFDESKYIQATLQQTQATFRTLQQTPLELWESIGRHLWHQDEPAHSFTSVVGYHLMGMARACDAKVLLNGQGADEVLGGYPSYFSDYWRDLFMAGRWWTLQQEMTAFKRLHGRHARRLAARAARACLGRLAGHLPGHAAAAARRRHQAIGGDTWTSSSLKQQWLDDHRLAPASLADRLNASVTRDPLPLYLRVEDRNSMAHGVEVRLPFLDYRLVTLAFRLGAEWKLRGPWNKYLLRESMRGRMPEIVRSRVDKLGFPTPVDQWFRKELYVPMRDVLGSRQARECGIWDTQAVARDLDRHWRGEISVGSRLFSVAQSILWVEGSRAWPMASGTR